MIDTHSHLYEPEFDVDRAEVVERAFRAGVEKIFLPNINMESILPMMKLCAAYPGQVFPMMGLHPTDVTPQFRPQLTEMEKCLSPADHPFIAIGEVGLDFYWDRSLEKEQKEAFRLQVEMALRHQLPLMIHTREAHESVLEILKDYQGKGLKGVFHCFGGTAEEARQLLEMEGFMLGIGGILTYKKSTLPDVLSSTVPLSRIVLETDSPYLAPVPHRGKRNESAFLADILKKVVAIYKLPVREVEKVTNENVKHVFGTKIAL